MIKLRSLFYYTTAGIALGFLINLLLFFSVSYEMMIGLGLVMYVFTGFGLMVGVSKKRLDWKYSFYIIEFAAVLIALFTGRLQQFLYISREALMLSIPISQLQPIMLVFVIIVNLINLYIILTVKKYQKEYDIPAMLKWSVSKDIKERIKHASFDEKISVTDLMLDRITTKIHQETETESCLKELTVPFREAGKSADFMVVDANPLDDLSVIRKPYMVVFRGRQFTKPKVKKYALVEQQLDSMK